MNLKVHFYPYPLADFDYISPKGRHVYVTCDSDVSTKISVTMAMERLAEHLKRKGADVYIVQLPDLSEGKTGVDDFLAASHRYHPDGHRYQSRDDLGSYGQG